MRETGVLLIAAFALACGADRPTAPPQPRFSTGLLQVSALTVRTDAAPETVAVQVSGSGFNACTEVGAVRQTRRGNVIDVGIGTFWDPQAYCILILRNLDVTVTLAGPFPPGEYVVRVNGFETSFRI